MGIINETEKTEISYRVGMKTIFKPLDFFEIFDQEKRYLCENLEQILFYGTLTKQKEKGTVIKDGLLMENIKMMKGPQKMKAYKISENKGQSSAEDIYFNLVLSSSGKLLPPEISLKEENIDIATRCYSALLTKNIIINIV